MDYEVSEEAVDAAVKAMEAVRKDWLNRPGVTAIDVGFRFKDGVMTNELAIRVHVERKIPEADLEPFELFPESIDDIPVDVIEARYSPQIDSS